LFDGYQLLQTVWQLSCQNGELHKTIVMTPFRAIVWASILLITTACGQAKKLAPEAPLSGIENSNAILLQPGKPDQLTATPTGEKLSSALSALPGGGSELQDQETGKRYRIQLDSIPGLALDEGYQSSIGSGMYLVAADRHSLSFTDQSLHDSVTYYLAQNTDVLDIELNLTDTVSFNREFRLPNPNSIRKATTFTFTAHYAGNTKNAYFISSSDSTYTKLIINDKLATRYYLDTEETLTFQLSHGYWKANYNPTPPTTHIQDLKDWGRHRFSLGDEVTFGENRKPYVIVSGTYLNHKGGKEVNDSIFVFRVPEKVMKVPNLLQNSEQIVRAVPPFDVVNGWNIQDERVLVINNYTTGPGGENNNASLLIHKEGNKTGTFTIRQTQIPTTAQKGDSLTVSFWAKALRPKDKTSVEIRYDPGRKIITPPIVGSGELSDEQWRHFVQTFDLKTDPQGFLTLSFNFTNEPGDSVIFAEPKVEIYPSFTEYIQTVDVYQYGTGYVYAVPVNIQGPSPRSYNTYIEKKELPLLAGNSFNIDEFQFPQQYDTDTKQFRYALEFCQRNSTCKEISFSRDKTWTDTLSLPADIGIIGIGNPKVTIDIANAKRHAIYCENSNGYAYRQHISGITFDVISPLHGVIYANNGSDQIFENNQFQLNYNANYGILIGNRKDGLRAIGSTIRNSSILQSVKAGVIYINCGNNHIWDNVRSSRSKGWGVIGDVAQIFLKGRNFESNEAGSCYFHDSGLVSITDTYYENAVLRIESTLMLVMEKSRLSGGDLVLRNVESARITSNRFFAGSSITMPGALKGELEIINNWFQAQSDFQTIRNRFDQYTGATILHNHGDDWKQEQGKLPASYFSKVEAKELYPEKLTISDKLVLNGTVVSGIRENLINYSDAFAEGASNPNFTIKTNAAFDQNGEKNAELFIGRKSTGATDVSLDRKEVLNGIVAGKTYVISQWVRDAKRSGSSRAELEFSLGKDKAVRLGNTTSKEWKQYTLVLKAQTSGNELARKVRNIMPGDSLEFGRLQVNTGETVLASVQTQATGIRDTSVNLIVGGNQVLNIGGNMRISDSQILSAYARSLKTPKAQRKTYSGFMSGFGNDGTQVEIPTNWDSSSGRTNSNGQVVIAHGLVSAGLSIAPDNIKLTDTSGDGHTFSVSGIDARQFIITVFSRGIPLRNSEYSFMWEAKAKAQ
jgi:hypothetical protein